MWGAEMVWEEDVTLEVMGLFYDNAIIDMARRKSTQLWKSFWQSGQEPPQSVKDW